MAYLCSDRWFGSHPVLKSSIALPQKLRGYRKIRQHQQVYRWKFCPGVDHSLLKILPDPSGGQVLYIALKDWRDPWLQKHASLPPNHPAIIAPGYVIEMMQQARQLGWNPEQPGKPLQMIY
ncbi:hypothetical protein GCM10008938_20960 [Deinococcus roseus]|uniref:Transposase IS701-like DDE domain-containing protein n=1 Tax=Deinococcus roseus TaxID=392414 RepID=A0ABQ2D0H8_9DEIO|nr:hypothetical protein GCM10008938_20960 [Deinococcus roseus]